MSGACKTGVVVGSTTSKAEVPKDREVIVHCKSGVRSQKAIDFLKSQGYTKLVNLTGGTSHDRVDLVEVGTRERHAQGTEVLVNLLRSPEADKRS